MPHRSPNPAPPLTIAVAGNPNCGKSALFNALTGYSRKEESRKILVSPHGMRRALVRRIRREIECHRKVGSGHIAFKMNSLVDREVIEADFVLAVGNVVPHISAGWGGGSKMILPGVCSHKTSDMMHLMACVAQPVMEVLGTRDNKPRAEMDAIAACVVDGCTA